jgi:hypothetical protein
VQEHQTGLLVAKQEEKLLLSKTTNISRSQWEFKIINHLLQVAMEHQKQELQLGKHSHLKQ